MSGYTGKKVMIGLSAGINSAAVLAWLIQSGQVPSELHLFYAHLEEHSPDSFSFVKSCIRVAKKHFPDVRVKVERHSVLRYFNQEKMIPHPTLSPCTEKLKIIPMILYCDKHAIEVDLVGYVRKEKRRINRMNKKNATTLFLSKEFPISLFDDEWCFNTVKDVIGWYPKIYDHKWNDPGFMEYVGGRLASLDEDTRRKVLKKLGTNARVFDHNNCLPCKNMYIDDMLGIEYFYPEYMKKANDLSEALKSHWGRDADDYYMTFGKQDYESPKCEICSFD